MMTPFGRITEPKPGRFVACSYLDSSCAFGFRVWERSIGTFPTQRKASAALKRDYMKRTGMDAVFGKGGHRHA